MKFFARGGGLAEGHGPIEKYFIVLAFQMASGGWRGGHLEGQWGKSLEPIVASGINCLF